MNYQQRSRTQRFLSESFFVRLYHQRILYYLSMLLLPLTRFKYTQSQHTKLILSIMALCCCCCRCRWQRFCICFTIAISDHATSIQWYVNVWFYYKLIARSIIRHWWCLHEWMLSNKNDDDDEDYGTMLTEQEVGCLINRKIFYYGFDATNFFLL